MINLDFQPMQSVPEVTYVTFPGQIDEGGGAAEEMPQESMRTRKKPWASDKVRIVSRLW